METLNILKISSQHGCKECEQTMRIYMQTEYLENLNIVPIDEKFKTQLLIDLTYHIQKSHPKRAKEFFKN